MLSVTLIQNTALSMITLPDKKEGRYFIEYYKDDGQKHTIAIDGKENSWMISSGMHCRIKEEKGYSGAHVIEDNDLFSVEIDGEECIILSEPVVQEKCMYMKLFLKNDDADISIGQKSDNIISINSRYVSGNHAVISRKNGVWTVNDMESKNGTFVNNRRITSSELRAGDTVSILGYKFIIGDCFISANIFDENIVYNKDVLYEKPAFTPIKKPAYENTKAEKKFFYRTLKLNEKVVTEKSIELEAPPALEKRRDTSSILRFGPSFTMCLGSVMTAGFSVLASHYRHQPIGYVMPSIIMACTMMCSAILWPLLLNKSMKKLEKKKRRERLELYSGYLSNARSEIERIINDESDVMNEINYNADRCAALAVGNGETPDKYLWCKNINDVDFLKVCIGKGDMEPIIDLKYPPKKLSLITDPLSDNLYQLVNEERKLKNVNIPVSLKDGCLCGCTGDKNAAEEFVKALVVQLTSLYSYDELKLVFIYNSADEAVWNYARWLPHVWNESNSFRYIASSSQDIKELSVQLEKEVTDRSGDSECSAPYFLIITSDRELTEQLNPIKQILKSYKDIRFSLVTLFYMRNYLDSDIIFDFEESGRACMYKRGTNEKEGSGTEDEVQEFIPDHISREAFTGFIDRISNIKLDVVSERYKLPKMVTFLEIFGVSKTEHLNCLTRWAENDPSKSLQTPIGVTQSGDNFYIDLHEKYHGPHGLIAGTTGSGKSETIISFILSIAVNYSPEEAAFLIIDYKGGGLADAFESVERVTVDGKEIERTVKLPHLAGTLTNLDGATIERSRISIESELKRRQNMFKVARKLSGEGTMDIYKYQELRRNGMELEALPHLFIVCDEFAELKAQQPDFMDSLVSTARIGRSLGVHLILATQKPDSVVSPQIWSNSRFKICLKVQDKADSTAVIHCPDAAEIKTTGRFYLQVGYNEQFSLGQSAWCGADYTEVNRKHAEKERSAELISSTGTVLCEKVTKNNSRRSEEHTISELVAVRQYLIDIAGNIKIRPLWLLPLPRYICLDEIRKEYSGSAEKNCLDVVIGKWDDLYERRQDIMTIPFSAKGDLCVYGAQGSGLDMFFITLIYSMIEQYSPEEVNIHILDFDSGYLKVFEPAPQVGSVLLSDETENIEKFIAGMKNEIISRNKLFAPYGGEYREYCRHSGNTVPNIVVIINNYSLFTEEYEKLIFDLAYIVREGVKVGVYTALGSLTSNIHSRVKQNIGQHITMRMNDKMEYTNILGKTSGIIPSEYKGRGLVKYGVHVYEFQTADILPVDPYSEETDPKDTDPTLYIRELCKAASEKYSTSAKSVVNTNAVIEKTELLVSAGDITSVPLGQIADSEEIYRADLSDVYMTFVSSYDTGRLSAYAEYMAEAVSADKNAEVYLIDTISGIAPPSDKKNYTFVSADDLEQWKDKFAEIYVRRDNAMIDEGDKNYRLPDNFGHVYIIINGFEELSKININCMANLVEAMLYCSSHRIHYIVLDTYDKMKAPCGCYETIIVTGPRDRGVLYLDNAHDEWFDQLGIWLGSGFNSQELFTAGRAEKTESSDNTGVIIRNRKAVGKFYLEGDNNG